MLTSLPCFFKKLDILDFALEVFTYFSQSLLGPLEFLKKDSKMVMKS